MRGIVTTAGVAQSRVKPVTNVVTVAFYCESVIEGSVLNASNVQLLFSQELCVYKKDNPVHSGIFEGLVCDSKVLLLQNLPEFALVCAARRRSVHTCLCALKRNIRVLHQSGVKLQPFVTLVFYQATVYSTSLFRCLQIGSSVCVPAALD